MAIGVLLYGLIGLMIGIAIVVYKSRHFISGALDIIDTRHELRKCNVPVRVCQYCQGWYANIAFREINFISVFGRIIFCLILWPLIPFEMLASGGRKPFFKKPKMTDSLIDCKH